MPELTPLRCDGCSRIVGYVEDSTFYPGSGILAYCDRVCRLEAVRRDTRDIDLDHRHHKAAHYGIDLGVRVGLPPQ